MWINITKDTFNNSEFKGLNYLYQIITYKPTSNNKPRYNIAIDVEKVQSTTNFKRLETIEPSLKEFLEEEYNVYVTSSDIPCKVTTQKGKQNYNIEEAIIFLTQPVSIVVENNKNDAEFILAIINHFGNIDGYNKCREHINCGWLVFENAGGCKNIPNFIEGFSRKFKTLVAKNNRDLSDYFRGIIIMDSDNEFKNQPIKSEHKSILNKISKLHINTSDILDVNDLLINQNKKIHILKKRMMENYLPKEVFEEIRRQNSVKNTQHLKDWLDAYLNINNRDQLDYMNIGDGNLLGNKTPAPKELNTLWETLGDNFQKLNNGFKFQGFHTNGNLKTLKENNFKAEMPAWFKKPFVTRQNLETRDGNHELNDILVKITALL